MEPSTYAAQAIRTTGTIAVAESVIYDLPCSAFGALAARYAEDILPALIDAIRRDDKRR